MKLIEALKKRKDLIRKADDLRKKAAESSAYLDVDGEKYADQKGQVTKWVQAHYDILKEISCLTIAIQRTNLATDVTIEIDGKAVIKNIAQWIIRRRDLVDLEKLMWLGLTDRGLKNAPYKKNPDDGNVYVANLVRCYDPKEKDKKIDILSSEKSLIDARLEIVNAITELVE